MLDPSTLVPAVDALERKGLVRRGKDPHDRRRVPLSLTERGTEFSGCVPLTDEQNPVVKGLQAMGDEQSHQLRALMRDLVRNMPGGEEILNQVSYRVRAHTVNAFAPSDMVTEK
jgi:DNA-binding MarR family transcriptional regulator